MQSKGRTFRQLLQDEPYLFTGGIYSPLDAQIAESAGMKSIYLSGYSLAMLNGWPDMGLLTMTEVTKAASMVASAVEVPIIADADDGYGNALSTMRTVQEFVKTGVAGIHIEDQRFPKRCGHIAGKTIVSREEALGKYRAALAERDRLDRDFVIIARTDAYGAVGGSMEEAIWRGRAYADAGVDSVWCELSSSDRGPAIEFARAMRQTHPKLPLSFNYSSSFRWHQDADPLTFRELGELGYKFIFITLYGAHASMFAVWNAMQRARQERRAGPVDARADEGGASDGEPSRDGARRPLPGIRAQVHSGHGGAPEGLGRLRGCHGPLSRWRPGDRRPAGSRQIIRPFCPRRAWTMRQPMSASALTSATARITRSTWPTNFCNRSTYSPRP